jgi:hypothetical protein
LADVAPTHPARTAPAAETAAALVVTGASPGLADLVPSIGNVPVMPMPPS